MIPNSIPGTFSKHHTAKRFPMHILRTNFALPITLGSVVCLQHVSNVAAQFNLPVPAPNPTVPPPTLPTGGNFLRRVGNELEWALGRCEGDCDKDSDCQGALICFRPDEPKDFVWGCIGEPERRVEYCIDPDEISPTQAPTRHPTTSPTSSPTSPPTVTLTAGPTSSPTIAPTASPSSVPTPSPTAGPTGSPSSSPSIPDKLYMPLDPVILRLTFPDRMEVSHTKKGTHLIEKIISDMYGESFRSKVSRFFWEAEIKVSLIAENEKEQMRQKEQHKETTGNTLLYEIGGDVAFVNTTDSVQQLPTPGEIRLGMTKVLNANALFKAFQETDHPVLSLVQSLDVKWNETSSSGPLSATTQIIIGALLCALVLALLLVVLYVFYRRKKEGRKMWTFRRSVPYCKGTNESCTDSEGSHKQKEAWDMAKMAQESSQNEHFTANKKKLSNKKKYFDLESGSSLVSASGKSTSDSDFSFSKIGNVSIGRNFRCSGGCSTESSLVSLPKNYNVGDASVDVSISGTDDNTGISSVLRRESTLGSVLEADDEGHDSTSAEVETFSENDGVGVHGVHDLAFMAALMRKTVEKGNLTYLPGGLAVDVDEVDLNDDGQSAISGVTACTGEIMAGCPSETAKSQVDRSTFFR